MQFQKSERVSRLQTFVELTRMVAFPATQNQHAVVPFLLSKLSCSAEKQKADSRACSGSCYIFRDGVKNTLPEVAPCPCRYFEQSISPFFVSLLRQFDCRASSSLLARHVPFDLAWAEQADPEILMAKLLVTVAAISQVSFNSSKTSAGRTSSADIEPDKGYYPLPWLSHCTPLQKEAAVRLQTLKNVEQLFCGPEHLFINWQTLRPSYLAVPESFDQFTVCHSRAEIQAEFAKKQCILLFWDFKNITIKAGKNPEIAALEEFLSDLESSGAGLVFFTAQPLLAVETLDQSSLAPDFNRDMRTTYRDAANKLRFTSAKAAAKPAASVRECLRKGSFDRLLEALARGQRQLDKLLSTSD